jgi:hypothetical protein
MKNLPIAFFAALSLLSLRAEALTIASEEFVRSGVEHAKSYTTTALNDYLPKSGGTMSGDINMGGNKVSGLATPVADADAVTKEYVDGLAAPQGGIIPWTELRAMGNTAFDNPHWGGAWEVQAEAHMIRGLAACLSANTKTGAEPSANSYGPNCWCRLSSVNGVEVLGPWVFNYTLGSNTICYSDCAFNCGACVRYGALHACTRVALFAAP